MKKDRLRKTGTFLGILLCIVFFQPLSIAGWEMGLPPNPPKTALSGNAQMPVDQFEQEILRLVNSERESRGIGALKHLQLLSSPAQVRAREAATLFSHTRPGGKAFFSIFPAANLSYQMVGENLAYGFQTPAQTVASWMGSVQHRNVILNSQFTDTAVGCYINENGKMYCAQLFYTP